MNAVQISVVIIGLALIAFIGWWFLVPYKQKTASAEVKSGTQNATIVVSGGYSPATIVLKKGVPGQVTFDMRDQTACLSHVVFEDLGVNADLTKQKYTTVQIPTDQAKTFNFACGMNMNHGKVVVK